jgi:hypothetical protein
LKAGLDIPYLLSEDGLAKRKLVLHVLSRYEFMAAGVNEGDFDAKIYKRMYYNNVVGDWNKLETFVLELRESRKNYTPFQEFQKLATKWKKHPLKAYRNLKPGKKNSESPTISTQTSVQSKHGESAVAAPPAQSAAGTVVPTGDAGKPNSANTKD